MWDIHSKGNIKTRYTFTYQLNNPSKYIVSVTVVKAQPERRRERAPFRVRLRRYWSGRDQKKVANETSTYRYNVRSWLTQITGTKFNQTVTPTKALYSGNISAMKWKAGDETVERDYKFTYDSMGRIASANYGEGSVITSNHDRFNEIVTYHDNMGNIGTLLWRGKLDGVDNYRLMDNLTFSYRGNHLRRSLTQSQPRSHTRVFPLRGQG